MKARALVVIALASCGPRWTLDDRTPARNENLPPGGSAQGTVEIEASHPIETVRTIVEGITAPSGRIRVEQVDSREACRLDATFEGKDGSWKESTTNANANASLTKDRFDLSTRCGATLRRANVTVRFTNQGDGAVSFAWRAAATTSGEGGEDPPSDAFIRVRHAP